MSFAFRITAALLIAAPIFAHCGRANQPGGVSAAVKLIAAAPAEGSMPQNAAMMGRPEPPPATLPAERLPQYQMRDHRQPWLSDHEIQRGEINFLLADSSVVETLGRPLLVRIVAQIDGQPFPVARHERAKAFLQANRLPSDQAESSPPETLVEQPQPSEADDDNAAVGSYQLTSRPDELLRRYAQAIGQPLSEDEAQWMLARWSEGPNLLLLHPFFQNFRSAERPVYQIVDRDRDGTISQKELTSAVESFQKCDVNRDQVVDVLEINESAQSLPEPAAPRQPPCPLLLMLADLKRITHDDPAFAMLQSWDADNSGRIESSEVAESAQRTPDIELLVRFDTLQPKESKLTLLSIAAPLQTSGETKTAAEPDSGSAPATPAGDIRVDIGDRTVVFSAVQQSSSDQISLGAVIDGYPLLPGLDPNDDGRFTIRELRQLSSRLREFDTDGDGQLSPREATSPLRVCIGLGAVVHRELARVRSTDTSQVPAADVGPEWFVRMDRNKDNDLTRGEFPGNDDQFQALDADNDRLVSAAEALQFDKQASENADNN